MLAVAMVVVVAQGNVAEDKATDRGPFKSIVDTTSVDEQAQVEQVKLHRAIVAQVCQLPV